MIYINKSLFNLNALFSNRRDTLSAISTNDFVENWVCNWVIMHPSELERNVDSLFGHSQKIMEDLKNPRFRNLYWSILRVVPEVVKNEFNDGQCSAILLVQYMGFFPLGIFFSYNVKEAHEISADEARDRIECKEIVSIAIVNGFS